MFCACLYCMKPIRKQSLWSLVYADDALCTDCRIEMKRKIRHFEVNGLRVETIYEYDSLFKSVLLQYKECYDEALSPVFLYGLEDFLRLKYRGYHILYAPSSKAKLERRGFETLPAIFSALGLPEVEGLRVKKERIQEGLNAKERKLMLDNFSYQGPRHKRILIVDDVWTTGSTVLGIYEAVKGHADAVSALVLAKA